MIRYNSLLKFGKLLQQLKSFGLDPSDWEIHDINSDSNLIYLNHRFDPEFKIAGVCNGFGSAKLSWSSIYVASI
jgi:hypothetical protein